MKFSATLPYAFTEHGAIMLASVLNSPKAIEASELLDAPLPDRPDRKRIGFGAG